MLQLLKCPGYTIVVTTVKLKLAKSVSTMYCFDLLTYSVHSIVYMCTFNLDHKQSRDTKRLNIVESHNTTFTTQARAKLVHVYQEL